MDRRVVWTEAARADLEQIVIYIAKDSSNYAAAFAREALKASRSLAQFSNRGREVPEFCDPKVREIFVRSYRLIYIVGTDVVHILGIVHGARDLRAIWDREEWRSD